MNLIFKARINPINMSDPIKTNFFNVIFMPS